MASVVIVGTQWGDEGKGKIVDLLTRSADYVVRFQGGNNAGHTLVVNKQQYIFHIKAELHPQHQPQPTNFSNYRVLLL